MIARTSTLPTTPTPGTGCASPIVAVIIPLAIATAVLLPFLGPLLGAAAVAWFAAALVLAVLLGRVIARRDQQIPRHARPRTPGGTP